MHLFSPPVLLGAVLISSPALLNSVLGEVQLDVGLARYLVAVVLSWVALSVVAMLIGPARPGTRAQPDASEAEARVSGGTD